MQLAHATLRRPDGRSAAALAVVSLAALVAALILQYGFGFAPCELCLWQRWPYVVSIATLAGGVLLDVPRAALMAASASFALGAGLAGYHIGIEEGLFALPEGCLAAERAQSVEELRQLLAVAPPRCDQATLLLGWSLAVWNLGLSLALIAAALLAVWWTRSRAEPDAAAASS
jgi:disulfide bond formation protein DsbB